MPTTHSPQVSIILPTFQEAEGIQLFLTKLVGELADWAAAEKITPTDLVEVLVVDDASPDGTAQKVTQFSQTHPQVKLLVRTSDPGLGLSILAGIEASQGQIIVGMDADNNHDPAQVRSLVEALNSADLVVASRFVGQGGMASRGRFYSTWIFNLILRALGFPILDNTSGFYAIHKATLVKLGLKQIYYGYGDYHLRLVYLAAKAGLTILEVPTKYLTRLAGMSKSKLNRMAWTYFWEALRLRFLS